MFDQELIDKLVRFISDRNGTCDKSQLQSEVRTAFQLTQDGRVFFCDSFAIRFCSATNTTPSNTVIALSKLQKYDSIPFFVCIVTPTANIILLSNSSLLKKVSHSSQALRVDNIRGSINASDIMRTYYDIPNAPAHFRELFNIHSEFSFKGNLERLVEATNNIVAHGKRYFPTDETNELILSAPERTSAFLQSQYFDELATDLKQRVSKVQNEIAIAAFIDNTNIRGRIIEYLITSNGGALREQILSSLHSQGILPHFKTNDELGDYRRKFAQEDGTRFDTATDIKTKILFLDSAPKGYNIDKLLSFLAIPDSVYLLFIVGIDDNKKITTGLFSAFDHRLIGSTRIQHHWAGRNSRGVSQLSGEAIQNIICSDAKTYIDDEEMREFLKKLIAL